MPPSSSSKDSQRPTLPPIRDLFRDELGQASIESPQVTLARLRVSDDEDRFGRESPRPGSEPSSSRAYHYHPPHRSLSGPNPSTRHSHGGYSHPPSSSLYEHPSLQRSYSHHQLVGDAQQRPYHHPDQHTSSSQARHHHHRGSVGSSDYHHGSQPRGVVTHDPRFTLSPAYPPPMSSSQRMQSMGDPRGYPWPISTRVDRPHLSEDDDRTPTARYPTQSLHPYRYPPHDEPRPSNPVPTSKYECHYCGKGFNRPSSLKIHLNSHTGEKPFACPVEGCGRSFSVLSNMRRHARVHTTNAGKEKEASSDEGALSSTSHSNSETGFSGPSNDPKWLQRRGSIASSTSSSSRRSRSASSDDEDDEDDHRPAEKRSRRVT